jgi:hypothetical protein
MLATPEAATGAGLVSSDDAPSAPVIDLLALEQALNEPLELAFDTVAIEQRYPQLRHTL